MDVVNSYNGDIYGFIPSLSDKEWDGIQQIELINLSIPEVNTPSEAMMIPMQYPAKPNRVLRFNSKYYSEYTNAKKSKHSYSEKRLTDMLCKAVDGCRYELFRMNTSIGFRSLGMITQNACMYNVALHTDNQFTLTCFDKISDGCDDSWMFKLTIPMNTNGFISVDYANRAIDGATLYINHRHYFMNAINIFNDAIEKGDGDVVVNYRNLIDNWYRTGDFDGLGMTNITSDECSTYDRAYRAQFAVKNYMFNTFMEYLATTHAFEIALGNKFKNDDYESGFITELFNEAIKAHNIKKLEDGTLCISTMDFNPVKGRRRITGRVYNDEYRNEMKIKNAQKMQSSHRRSKRVSNDNVIDKPINNVETARSEVISESINTVSEATVCTEPQVKTEAITIGFEVNGSVFKFELPDDGLTIYQNDTKIRIFKV